MNDELLRSVTAYELSNMSELMNSVSEARGEFSANTELGVTGRLDVVTSTGETVGQLVLDSTDIVFVGNAG